MSSWAFTRAKEGELNEELIARGNVAQVRELVAAKADVNARDVRPRMRSLARPPRATRSSPPHRRPRRVLGRVC